MKKYVPYLLLPLLLICFYLFRSQPPTDETNRSAPVAQTQSPEVQPDMRSPVPGKNNVGADLNRSATRIIYSRHARCRMDCRHITESEVKEILAHGEINTEKIETDSRGTTYPLEGISEGHHLRIVFAPKGNKAVEVVTCIDLDTEWPCHCN